VTFTVILAVPAAAAAAAAGTHKACWCSGRAICLR